MPRSYFLTGSEVGYFSAGSPSTFDSAGSFGVFNLSNYTYATLLVTAGCINTGFEAALIRSGTSNGTFASIGNISMNTGSALRVKSFSLESSAVFYQVWRNNGTGSCVAGVVLIGQGARVTPIAQPTGTSVLGSVL